MCFIVDENNKEVLIADKDIVCFKYTYNKYVEKKGFASLVMHFPYIFNKLYKRNALSNIRYEKEVHTGFHSYIKKPYMSIHRVAKTIRCIIPKGSRYLKNPKKGEYISNMIIPIKVVKNKYYN